MTTMRLVAPVEKPGGKGGEYISFSRVDRYVVISTRGDGKLESATTFYERGLLHARGIYSLSATRSHVTTFARARMRVYVLRFKRRRSTMYNSNLNRSQAHRHARRDRGSASSCNHRLENSMTDDVTRSTHARTTL